MECAWFVPPGKSSPPTVTSPVRQEDDCSATVKWYVFTSWMGAWPPFLKLKVRSVPALISARRCLSKFGLTPWAEKACPATELDFFDQGVAAGAGFSCFAVDAKIHLEIPPLARGIDKVTDSGTSAVDCMVQCFAQHDQYSFPLFGGQ